MAVSAEKIASYSKICRQTGLCKESAEFLAIGKTQFPDERCIAREQKKLRRATSGGAGRLGRVLSRMIDNLGMPAFLLIVAALVYGVLPVLFVAAH